MEPDDRGGKTLTAKEYLRRYQDANREIDALLEEINDLRIRATSITQALTPDRVQTTPTNRTESIVAKLVDMERKVDSRVNDLHKIEDEVMQTIRKVENPVYRELLIRKYILGKTLEEIAVKMHYSYRQTCRIHGMALICVKDVL